MAKPSSRWRRRRTWRGRPGRRRWGHRPAAPPPGSPRRSPASARSACRTGCPSRRCGSAGSPCRPAPRTPSRGCRPPPWCAGGRRAFPSRRSGRNSRRRRAGLPPAGAAWAPGDSALSSSSIHVPSKVRLMKPGPEISTPVQMPSRSRASTIRAAASRGGSAHLLGQRHGRVDLDVRELRGPDHRIRPAVLFAERAGNCCLDSGDNHFGRIIHTVQIISSATPRRSLTSGRQSGTLPHVWPHENGTLPHFLSVERKAERSVRQQPAESERASARNPQK